MHLKSQIISEHFVYIQDPLAGLGAGFGSASADISLTESLRIPAERLSIRQQARPDGFFNIYSISSKAVLIL